MPTLIGFNAKNGSSGGRWLIVVLVLFYPLVLFVGGSLKVEYSHISQYISELNAVGTAWSWQIGFLGFLPLSLLGLLLLLLVAPQANLNGISKVGCWLLIAEPVAYISSVFAPCDMGCPDTGSLAQNIHNFAAVITLLMTTVGLVFLSFNDRLAPAKRMGWLLLAATFVALYSLALVPDFDEWRGLLQRLAEGILYGSLCLVSWRILAGSNSPVQPDGESP